MPPGRSVLLVAHLSPPSPISSARRVAGFARHLGRLGHRVTVLASVLSGAGPVDGTQSVVRTRDLMRTRFNWRKESFAALEGKGDATPDLQPSRLADVVVPDLQAVTWMPFALPRALALQRERRFDCVFTSGPPPSTLLVGLALRRRHGVPWIADLRDGWRFETYRAPWPSALQDRLDAALERAVFTTADGATAVTEPIAADLRERFGVHARAISNGFDPEEVADLGLDDAPAPDLLDGERHSMLYTGRLGYAIRDPAPLIAGLKTLRASDPEVADRVEVAFAGPLSAAERATIEDPELRGMTRVLGAVDRPDALRLQRAADSLLLITCGTKGETGQKLFEYLAADRPIFVLGDESEAARIVADAGAGPVATRHDPAAVAAAIKGLVEAGANGGGAPDRTSTAERFSYATLAGELSEEIERAIAHRDSTR